MRDSVGNDDADGPPHDDVSVAVADGDWPPMRTPLPYSSNSVVLVGNVAACGPETVSVPCQNICVVMRSYAAVVVELPFSVLLYCFALSRLRFAFSGVCSPECPNGDSP